MNLSFFYTKTYISHSLTHSLTCIICFSWFAEVVVPGIQAHQISSSHHVADLRLTSSAVLEVWTLQRKYCDRLLKDGAVPWTLTWPRKWLQKLHFSPQQSTMMCCSMACILSNASLALIGPALMSFIMNVLGTMKISIGSFLLQLATQDSLISEANGSLENVWRQKNLAC